MRSLVEARNIPGVSLALTRNGDLVLARRYTFNDGSEDRAVEPHSLFRVVSLTKPITAAPVLRLVQDSKLDPSARLRDLPDLVRLPGRSPDPILRSSTVRYLLQHLNGWYRGLIFDPQFHDSNRVNWFLMVFLLFW